LSVSHFRNRSCDNISESRVGSPLRKKKVFKELYMKQLSMDIDLANRKVTFDNFDNEIDKAGSHQENKEMILFNEVLDFKPII
jgi:hypothetical protein